MSRRYVHHARRESGRRELISKAVSGVAEVISAGVRRLAGPSSRTPREVHSAHGKIRRPGATKAVAEEVRLGKGRLRGAAGEGGDARHEVRPDVRGTGHGTRADIMGTEVIARVPTGHARESRSR